MFLRRQLLDVDMLYKPGAGYGNAAICNELPLQICGGHV